MMGGEGGETKPVFCCIGSGEPLSLYAFGHNGLVKRERERELFTSLSERRKNDPRNVGLGP
jgi:hypothetical protein